MRPGVASWIADENVAAAASSRSTSSGADQPGDPPVCDAQHAGRQLRGGHARHPVDELVRFVDDEQAMLGQDRGVGDGVDGQQRMVGDDDIGVAGLIAGLLGEAVHAEWAAGGPDAFPCRDADLPP